MTEASSAAPSLSQDQHDLRRGSFANLMGYLLRVALPALNVLVVRWYGPERFGNFVVAQASLLLAFRATSLGYDKAALWWVPRMAGAGSSVRPLLLRALRVALPCSVLGLLLIMLLPGVWVSSGLNESTYLVALGLLPLTVLELCVHASMGARNMLGRVLVRDVLVPALQLGLSLAFAACGLLDLGLSGAYLIALMVGALVSAWLARALLGSSLNQRATDLPAELRTYARAIWLSELASTLLSRLDVLVIAQVGEARMVGVYAAAGQLANVLRSVRQAFDPIVLTICSQASIRGEMTRVRAGISRATESVLQIQVPIWAFMVCFAQPLIGLFGASYAEASAPLLVLASVWLLNGAIGLSGNVLLGLGRADIGLWGALGTGIIQLPLLVWWVPTHGALGAAWAAAVSYLLLNLAQLAMARVLAITPLFDRRLQQLLRAGGPLCAALLLLAVVSPAELRIRLVTFLGFVALAALIYAWLAGREKRLASAL